MQQTQFSSELFHKESNIEFLRQEITTNIQKLVSPQNIPYTNNNCCKKNQTEKSLNQFSSLTELNWKLTKINENIKDSKPAETIKEVCKESEEVDKFLSSLKPSLSQFEQEEVGLSVCLNDVEALQKSIFYGFLNDYEFLMQLMVSEILRLDKNCKGCFLFHQNDNLTILRSLNSQRKIIRKRFFCYPFFH